MFRVQTVITGFGGGPFLNTLYFDEAGGTAQQAADAARNFWAGIAGLMVSTLGIQVQLEVAQINAATGALTGSQSIVSAPLACTSAGDPLPSAAQGLIRFLTGVVLDGRFVKGRCFVPGLTELNNTGTRLTATSKTSLEVAANNLIADINSVLVVWHRPKGVPPAGGVQVVASGRSVWDEFAVLTGRRD